MKTVAPPGRLLAFVSIVIFMACDQNMEPLPDPSAPALQPVTIGHAIPGDIQDGSAGAISGAITIASELSARLTGSEAVYIMLRPLDGGAPLAVQRADRLQFPMSYTLTSANRMAQDGELPGEVSVVVRVDRDGIAGSPEAGDMEGSVARVTIGQTDVDVVIDKIY